MAGIGFELKKLFVGSSAISKIRAYAYASVITSGTMVLAIVLMLGVQLLVKAFDATDTQLETLVVMMVYAMLGSLIFSSLLQMLLSRFVADMMYQKRNDKILPSLFGGTLLLIIIGGGIYAAFLWQAHELSVLDRIINWALFTEMMMVWLQMAYITAAKDYKRILLGFAIGVILVFAIGVGLMLLGVSPVTSMMIGLFVGYGVMLTMFTRVLLTIFPVGSGSILSFLEWIGKYPDLVFTGFFSMSGAFVHMIVMWFSTLGIVVAGLFRFAPLHDSAAFFAYLVAIPTSINFVVSVEVDFYKRYQRYFSAITTGGTLAEIHVARDNMKKVLLHEILRLTHVQIFVMVLFTVLMRYVLESLSYTRDMIAMFQIMSVGYSAYALGNSMMLLQLYFNDRKGALMTCLLYFFLNLTCTLITLRMDFLFYGLGMTVAGIAMYIFSILRLLSYVGNIDYHVFCGQPVLAVQKTSMLSRLADRLNSKANAAENKLLRYSQKGDK